MRQDNPAAGLKAPKDKTERSERVKFLPLDGLRRLLTAPIGSKPGAVRDRAMLALVGRHGLRVSEVAGLTVDALDLDAGTVRVVGKRSKERIVPVGSAALESLRRYIDEARPALLRGRQSPYLFVSRLGTRLTTGGLWKRLRGPVRGLGRRFRSLLIAGLGACFLLGFVLLFTARSLAAVPDFYSATDAAADIGFGEADGDWTKRAKLTFSNTEGLNDLVAFPVLVVLDGDRDRYVRRSMQPTWLEPQETDNEMDSEEHQGHDLDTARPPTVGRSLAAAGQRLRLGERAE